MGKLRSIGWGELANPNVRWRFLHPALGFVLLTPTCLLALTFSVLASAAIEPLPFESELEEQRFRALAEELRCAVCQNQSLADSDAPLAHDLRQVVFAQLREGRSDQEIRQFMVERYGDFVLYRTPVKGHTALLWFGPVLLLLGSLAGVALIVRKRKRTLNG